MSITPTPLPRTKPSARRKRRILAITSLGLAGLLAGLLSGCSSTPPTPQNFTALSGNWQFATASVSVPQFTSINGSLNVTGSTVTGTVNPGPGSCTTTPSEASGTINSAGVLTLTAHNLAGGSLALTGTVAPDRHSLTGATYTVTGGTCATPHAVAAISQQYLPINGTYTGTFSDADGVLLSVSATLTQTSQPDANGVFHLAGNATFANNPCLNTPVVTDSTVTGNILSDTYTDAQTGNSVTASGTFSTDATALTITNWTLNGSCGPDTGTGLLSKHS